MSNKPSGTKPLPFKSTEKGRAYGRLWSTVNTVAQLPDTKTFELSGTGPQLASQMEDLDASFPSYEMLAAASILQKRVFELDHLRVRSADFLRRTALSRFRQKVFMASGESSEMFACVIFIEPCIRAFKHRRESLGVIQIASEDDDGTARIKYLTRTPSGRPPGMAPRLACVDSILTTDEAEEIATARAELSAASPESLDEAIAPFTDPEAVAAATDHPFNRLGFYLSQLAADFRFQKDMGLLTATPANIAELNQSIRSSFDLAS